MLILYRSPPMIDQGSTDCVDMYVNYTIKYAWNDHVDAHGSFIA